MNPGEFQSNNPIRNPVLNPFLSANTSLLQNQPIINLNQNLNSSSAQIVQEKREIIKDQNGTKIIEEKKYEINSIPFKSLLKEETTKIINSSNNLNNTNNTPVNNPFANDLKLNDISPNNVNLNKNRNSTYKIELFRSQNKSGEKSPDKAPISNVQVINLNKKNFNNDERYKILVKKIATQLRKRIKLPTSKILKIYESYVILIKRIAKALKVSMDKKIKVNKIEEEKTNTIMEKPIEIIEENKIIIKKPESKKNSKSKRKIVHNMTLLRKSEEEKEMKLNEQNMMSSEDKNELKQNLNQNQDDNINLSNIEVTQSNFINDFKKFLDKENISLVNGLPEIINQKIKLYLEHNKFWFLIINYIFYINKELSFYNLLALLDKYFLWCTEKTKDNFALIKNLVLEYITRNFTTEKINQFLFMNKLTNIEEIFEKYELSIKSEEKANELKQEKIYELNLINNILPECNCDLCQNELACIKKVADMNKNKIQIIKGQNIDFIGNKELNNKNNELDIDSGEEIYYKGITDKKNNKIFTASKTRFSENTNFVFTSTMVINNIKNDSDEKNKTFKNISKRKNKISEEKKEEKEEIKQEEKEETKEEIKQEEEKEETKEEKEEKEDETKNRKKSRKTKKDKSRNKNKNKKRDSSKSDKNEDDNEEKEEKEEEGKQKKKKKTKKYKNLDNDNDSSKEDDTEDKEKDKEEQKSRNKKKSRTKKNKNSRKKEDSDEKDDDNDESLNKNPKRKKSKTPKNKKSQNIN